MSELLWSRVNPAMLYPPFYEKARALVAAACDFWVVSGFRSYDEQQRLYFKGRTSAGPKVTNAMGGESPHNFGLAIDVCRDALKDRAGLQPDYDAEAYEVFRELAPKYGLVWGGSWHFPDNSHLQWPGYVSKGQLHPLRAQFGRGGLRAVFEFLDTERGSNASG